MPTRHGVGQDLETFWSRTQSRLPAATSCAATTCPSHCRRPPAVAQAGVVGLGAAVDLVSTTPAAALGLPSPTIEVGKPLTEALGTVSGTTFIGAALWRAGRRTFSRDSAAAREGNRTPTGV
ncbi:hypothetical protein GCM10009609_41060 [Pseudonocardia aurantiaca]|uniref:Uncharacterized protein n=1 Tax=Pseudonocardia aurantiaca TaxID=75290 RepID=A0ABW4FNP4_9PSEU